MNAPGLDALEVALVEIAGPPDQAGRVAGEVDHVLPGSAAELDHVAGAAGKMLFQYRPERFVIAMKRGCIEAAIRLDPPAVPAKFDDIFSQLKSPEKKKQTKTRSEPSAREKMTGPNRPYGRTSSLSCNAEDINSILRPA
jgi:hypothetical protein